MKTFRIVGAVLLAALFAGGCVTKGEHEKMQAEKDQQIGALTKERDSLQQQIRDMQSQRTALEKQQASLRGEIAMLEKQKGELEKIGRAHV